MEYLEDKDIIELFIARDERAITETIRKYNSRLHGRVMYILNNIEDVGDYFLYPNSKKSAKRLS